MSEVLSVEWLDAALQRKVIVPVLVLHTGAGDRVYGLYWPGVGWVFEGVPVIDRGARILSVSNFEQTAEPMSQEVIGSWAQIELPHATVELDNTDRQMSDLVGSEYLLGKDAEVYMTFPGLTPVEAILKISGQVKEWHLKKRSLILEIERL